MDRLRTVVVGLGMAGLFAACSLIDPLDDISGGSPKGSTKKDGGSASSSASSGSSSSSSGDDDDDTSASSSSSSSSSGGPTLLCVGPKEVEPNEATANASPLASPQSCGTLTKGSADVDRWIFTNDTGDELQITMKVDATSPLNVSVQSGGNSITGTSGQAQITSLAPDATFLMQLTPSAASTEDIAYKILFVPQ